MDVRELGGVLRLVAGPEASILTEDEVRAHLRYDDTDQDPLIGRLIAAAAQRVDGWSGILGRCLVSQQWALDLDRFPCSGGVVPIPLPPTQTIDSVEYLPVTGSTVTLAAGLDYVAHVGADAMVEPANGRFWPTTKAQRRAVTITFTAGYGDAAADVPAPIRQAMLLMIGDWFENREAQVIANGSVQVVENRALDALLAPYRVISF